MLVLSTHHFHCFYSVKFERTQQTPKSKLSVIYSRMTFIETFCKSENLDWNFDIESLKSLIQLAVDKIKLLRQMCFPSPVNNI